MDSSEACYDEMEAQTTIDMSRDQQEMTLINKDGSTLSSGGFSQSRRDNSTTIPIGDTESLPDCWGLYNFPGESVGMNLDILCAMRAGNIDFLEKMKNWETPMGCFKNDKEDSILHIASASGHLRLVQSIVCECPYLLLEPNWNDQIPLHVAACSGQSEIVEFLVLCLRHVSDILAKANRGRLNPYVLRDKNGDTPLHLVLKEVLMSKQPYVYQPWLLRMFTDASKSMIKTAFCLVNAECASFLANKDGVSPLYLAVEAGNVSLVNAMLNHPCNNVQANTSEPASQLEERKSLVHAAIKSKNIDILNIIFQKYPSLVNERDEEGRTCLSVAASVGFYKGLCMLLDKTSLSVFECDEDGSLPIHTAVEKGHEDICNELILRFPDSVEQINKKGQNILHIAAKSAKARYTITHHIVWDVMYRMIQEQDVDGNTPVHLATIYWRPKFLHKLVNYSPYSIQIKVLNKQNADGLRPLDIAEKNLQPDYVFRERMTLMVLLKHCSGRGVFWLPTSGMTLRSRSEKVVGSGKYKDLIQVLLVVTALVTTVTFAAGFTMPGGFNSSDTKPDSNITDPIHGKKITDPKPGKNSSDLGMAILVDNSYLKNFLILDTVAMYSSMIAIVALIWAQLGDQELTQRAFHLALPSLFIALISMAAAFFTGVMATISPSNMLSTTLTIVYCIFSVATGFLLAPFMIPQISGIPIFTRLTGVYLAIILRFTNDNDDDEKNYTSGNGHMCVKRVESEKSSSGNQVEKSKVP